MVDIGALSVGSAKLPGHHQVFILSGDRTRAACARVRMNKTKSLKKPSFLPAPVVGSVEECHLSFCIVQLM